MTDERTTGGQAKDAFNEHVVEPARKAGEALRQTSQKAAESGATLGVKMIDHAEQNAREAFNAMRAAAQAKDAAEVMRIQGDFLREAGNRGVTQAREIAEVIAQFGRDVVKPFRGG